MPDTTTRLAILTVALLLASPAAQCLAQSSLPPAASAAKLHKLAIHVDEMKPETMNLALNNAQNVLDHFKALGQPVKVEIVAYGPGLHMLRDDTSPVKSRIAAMSLAEPDLTFVACENTRTNQSKQEGKAITLIPEAKSMPSGVVRLMELQADGYAYVRP